MNRSRFAPLGALCFSLALLVPCSAAGTSRRTTDAIREAGDGLEFLIPASATAMAIDRRDRSGTLEFAESASLSTALTFGLKYAIDERRPNGGSHSFPSGHTSISFCSAEFMSKRYGWRVGLPAFVAATFVGYSRVESKEHYVHDVLAGAAIGIMSGDLLTRSLSGCRIHAAAARGPGSQWCIRVEIARDQGRARSLRYD